MKDLDTVIFFDTGLFSQMFKLHTDARKEFYSWFNSPDQKPRVKITSWSMQEYNERASTGQLKGYLDGVDKLGTIQKLLENMSSFLNMYYNQEVNKGSYPDKEAFMADVELVKKTFNKIKGATKYDTLSIHTLNEEFSKHFQDNVVVSNIFEMISTIKHEAEFRALNNIPPGFFDVTKTDNKYGDLIIWKEILNYAKENNTKSLIFVSNDGKKDIVYYPFVKRGNGKLDEMKDVRLPDPRLVAEFHAYTGSDNLSIISFSSLINFLSDKDPASFRELSGSIQIAKVVKNNAIDSTAPTDPFDFTKENDLVAEFNTSELESIPLEDQNTLESDSNNIIEPVVIKDDLEKEVTPIINDDLDIPSNISVGGYGKFALADGGYENTNTDNGAQIYQLLKANNWYSQNEGINLFRKFPLLEIKDKDLLFVIGRNIYQAGCGNAFEAINFLDELSNQLLLKPIFVSEHILNGIFYEIYFNNANEFRRNKFKADLIGSVFATQTINQFQPSIKFITSALAPFKKWLIIQPNSVAEKAKVEILIEPGTERTSVQEYMITNILINQRSVLLTQELTGDSFTDEFGFTQDVYELRIDLLLKKISERLAIPVSQMELVPIKLLSEEKKPIFSITVDKVIGL
ncbi:PIN-like domain-containing protein [Pedobacter sp. KBW06]|uniref:PIN-like domain-containing protein n=1 Tax=Pedobacter sp. KBW06 TaxID=2153359 RepID=UPI001F35D5BC|nr:PIN-like domain-containing protein [Pedobacter sp. KBW06]